MVTALENSKLIAEKAWRWIATTVDGVTTISEPISPEDKIKATDSYKKLIEKWFSETQILEWVKNKTNIEKMTPVNANVTPIEVKQDIVKPEVVAPVEVKTEVTKPEVKKDKTISDYSLDTAENLKKISTNLDSYAVTSPDLFKDKTTFQDFFKYNERTKVQKQLLDAKFNNAKYTNMFSWKSVASIGDQFLNGQVTGNDLQSLNTIDPATYTAVQSYIDKANTYNKANGAVSWKESPIDKISTELWIEQPKDVDLTAKYDETLWSPEILAQSTKLTWIKAEIDTYDQQIADMKSTIEKTYEWTWMTSDMVSAIVADKQEALSREKTRKTITYNAELVNYNNMVGTAQKKYDAFVQEQTYNQQKFENELQTINAKRQQDYQKQSLETGKFSAIADWFGWITVFNTKTWGILNWWTSSSSNTSSSASSQTNDWYVDVPRNGNWYTDNVWADTNNFWNLTNISWTAGKYKSPNGKTYAVYNTAEEWYNALIGDLKAKQTWNTKTGLNANSTVSELLWTWVNWKWTISSWSYYDSFIKQTWLKWTDKIWSIDAAKLWLWIMAAEWTLKMYQSGWINLSWLGWLNKQSNTNNTNTNTWLWYKEQYANYYQQNLDWNMDFKTAKLWWYTWTPEQFTKEAEAYRTRVENALQTVWVNKDDFSIKVNSAVWLLKVDADRKNAIQSALYNKIVSDPTLALPENEWKLWTEITWAQQPSKALIDWITLLQSKRKILTEKWWNTRTNWVKYQWEEWNISNIWGKLWIQPTWVVNDFLQQSKIVGSQISKLIENGRLSDSDRTYYQSLMPKLNTPTYQDWVDKLNNIKTTFLWQWAPWWAWIDVTDDDWL